MEVAVIKSPLITSIVLCVAFVAAGCQEAINYSAESRAQGVKLYNQGQYADAAGAFRNAVRKDTRDYKSFYYLGASYEQLKQYQQAIQAYKSSLDIATRTLEGRADDVMRMRTVDSLASVIAKSDPQGAELTAAEQKAQASQKARDFYLVGRIHQFRLDPDSAIDAYNRAALLDQKDFYIAKEFGLYLVQLGQTQKGDLQLRRAYQLRQNDPQVNQTLASINVVPGPGLKEESQLRKPLLPKGPLPEVDLAKLRILPRSEKSPEPASPPPPIVPTTPVSSTDQSSPHD